MAGTALAGWPSPPLGASCPSENISFQPVDAFLSLSLHCSRTDLRHPSVIPSIPGTHTGLSPVYIKAEAINQSDFMSVI